MTQELLISVISLGIAAILMFLGWPKSGESPRFLRSTVGMMLYPPVILVFFVVGLAELTKAVF